MRREEDLDDKVNVHSRAIKAAERAGSNGKMQHALHVTEPTVADTVPFWERFKLTLPHAERLDVAGRTVNGFVVPTWAAGVILAAVLGSVGFLHSRIGDQRDMLIRLDTQLQERDRHELEYRAEFKDELRIQKVYIDNLIKDNAVIQTMLTPQQLRAIERETKKTEN